MWLVVESTKSDAPNRTLDLREVALGTELVVGRDEAVDVALTGRGVSRRHLVLRRIDEGLTFTEATGAVGTRLNGERTSTGLVREGDVLTLGTHRLFITLQAPPATGTPAPDGWQHFQTFVDTLLDAVDAPILVNRLLQGLLVVTEADRGYVLLRRGTAARLVPVASQRLDDPEAFAEVSSTITSAAVAAGKLLVIENSTTDGRCSAAASLAATPGPRTIFCAPLEADGDIYGVVYVDGPCRSMPLPTERLATLSSACGLAGRLLASQDTRQALLAAATRARDLAALTTGAQRLLVGDSPAGRRLFALVEQVAAQDVTVLVTGETGSGKEVVATEIHRRSPRRDGPFVAVNCAALPADLAEAELFGVLPGAFTGASERRLGRFELATGGTLFLDEVGELTPDLQTKLLRVLQERRCTPLGATDEVTLDFRLICATNRDLSAAVADGRFRADLLYRINTFPLPVPALRERKTDIVPLAVHFLTTIGPTLGRHVDGFADDARRLLEDHDWPGNIRELRNACERALIVETSALVRAESLPFALPPSRRAVAPATGRVADPASERYDEALGAFEADFFRAVMARYDGDIQRVAAATGISRATLYRRLAKYGLLDDGSS